MKLALLACAALAAACATPLPRDETSDAARSLADAERAFAAQSVRENGRAAFLAHFAADGVLVRNGWTPALPAVAAQPVAPLVLDWHPAYVEAARSGDLGLSTGPWTITPRDPAKPRLHGQFVSVWRRGDGAWKVRADIGIAHPGPALEEAPLAARVAGGPPCAQPARLDEAEHAFAAVAAREGVASALRAFGAQDLRLYREGTAPRLGLDAALAAPAGDARPRRDTVQAQAVARSGELGFAYGAYAAVEGTAEGVWLRVWRCEAQGWRVALDIANAVR